MQFGRHYQSGAPRTINHQGWYHPGVLRTNSMNVINGHSQEFKCNCPCFRVNVHYPTAGCNKHNMDMHIPTNLIRSVIKMVARARRGPSSSYAPRGLSRRERSRTALLSKEEGMRRFQVEGGREHAFCEVGRFLSWCEKRRAAQRPPLSEMAWKNRLRWDGRTIGLTPIVGCSPVG